MKNKILVSLLTISLVFTSTSFIFANDEVEEIEESVITEQIEEEVVEEKPQVEEIEEKIGEPIVEEIQTEEPQVEEPIIEQSTNKTKEEVKEEIKEEVKEEVKEKTVEKKSMSTKSVTNTIIKNTSEPMATVNVYVNNGLVGSKVLSAEYGSITIWEFNNQYNSYPTSSSNVFINGQKGYFLYFGNSDNCNIFTTNWTTPESEDQIIVNLYYIDDSQPTYGIVRLKFADKYIGREVVFNGEKEFDTTEETYVIGEDKILSCQLDTSYHWTFSIEHLTQTINFNSQNEYITDVSLETYAEPTPDEPDGLDHTLTVIVEFNREPGGTLIDLSSDTKFDSLETTLTKKGGDTITWHELIGSFNEIEILDSTIIYNEEEFRDSSLGMTGPNCNTGSLVNRGETVMTNGDAKIIFQFIYIEPIVEPEPEPEPEPTPQPEPTPEPEPTPTPEPVPEPTPEPTPTPTPTPTPQPEPMVVPSQPTQRVAAVVSKPVVESEPTVESAPAPKTTIPDSSTPKAKPIGSWALINLIATILSCLIAIFLIFVKKQKEDDEEEYTDEEKDDIRIMRLFKIMSLIFGVLSIIIFIFTEDMSLPMVLVDKWTLLMILLLIIEIVNIFIIRRKSKGEESDD